MVNYMTKNLPDVAQPVLDRALSLAPMMEWTDRHFRYLLRLGAPKMLLYTEMVTAAALIHGDTARLLAFHPAEQPLALQLGGSEPSELARAARMGEAAGYDEINLNVGCPSDRVQSGRFGACLMAEPELVADCVRAMRAAVRLPVTVKCRIGIDDQDTESDLRRFIETVAAAGCSVFIVHARKAWLQGLNPKQNRDIPPLDYDRVYRLKRDYPELTIVLNGGITEFPAVQGHLARLDGVMIGRHAYADPCAIMRWDRALHGLGAAPGAHALVRAYLPYIEHELAAGTRLAAMTRHMLALFQAVPGARAWRRHWSENAFRTGAGVEVVEAALAKVPEHVAA
jgi:tRNA-dihydrouridine synthase A